MPPAVNKSNVKKYNKSAALTEYVEFEGRDHWTCAAPGWEAIADHALDWAMDNARPGRVASHDAAPTDVTSRSHPQPREGPCA